MVGYVHNIMIHVHEGKGKVIDVTWEQLLVYSNNCYCEYFEPTPSVLVSLSQVQTTFRYSRDRSLRGV